MAKSLAFRGLVTAMLDGRNLGSFQTMTGQETTAESVRDRPPGSDFEESLGGPKSRTNITITRTFDPDVDTADLRSWSRGRVGRVGGSVSLQPLDSDMNIKGRPDTSVGLLIRYKGPEVDTNSSDKQTVEYEFEL